MPEDVWDAIGNTLRGLLRPTTTPTPDGVIRAAVLYADLGNFHREDREVTVVYRHQSGEDVDDISSRDLIPDFDVLAVNLPDGAEANAFSFALRFLYVRRPSIFLLLPATQIELPQADEFLYQVRDRTRRMGYRVHSNQAVIVGMLENPENDVIALLDW